MEIGKHRGRAYNLISYKDKFFERNQLALCLQIRRFIMAKRRTTLMETETPEKRMEIIPKETETKDDAQLYEAEIKRLEAVIREKNQIISNLQEANEQISHELSEVRNK